MGCRVRVSASSSLANWREVFKVKMMAEFLESWWKN